MAEILLNENVELTTDGFITIEKTEPITYCFFNHRDPLNKLSDILNERNLENIQKMPDNSIRVLVAKIYNSDEIVEIFPIILNYQSPNFLKPKYENINTIVFDGYNIEIDKTMEDREILSGLPSCIESIFQKTLLSGLGFRQAYSFIPRIIESQSTTVDTIVISKNDKTELNQADKRVVLNQRDLSNIRKGLNHINYETGRTKAEESNVLVYNSIFHKTQPERFPEAHKKRKVSVVYRELRNTDIETVRLSAEDKNNLTKSKNNIDLSYFSVLHADLKKLIDNNSNEDKFQKFFHANPLLLTLLTGMPYTLMGEKMYVGGKGIDNKGGEEPDFLLKHLIMGNTAIVEIKTPNSTLINARMYRNNVVAAHYDLTGAITQVLSQKHTFMQYENGLHKPGMPDFCAYNPQCIVIIGKLASLDTSEKQRSFELFRTSQKDVKIITYDECLYLLEEFVKALSEKK